MKLATCLCAVLVLSFVGVLHADLIEESDVKFIPDGTVGSGNGTLDLRMATFSGSEIGNDSGSFNADNGNNTLPNSNSGGDTFGFAESYVTTAKEIKDFYLLNFPNGTGGTDIGEIVVFLDLNETKSGDSALVNRISVLDVVQNPLTIFGSPNPAGDVTSAQQAAINQTYTGGIVTANLAQVFTLPVRAQGAGFADYAFMTGIDPFALADSDVLLFNFSMVRLSNGAEELFLSGEFADFDIVTLNGLPEPGSTIVFVAFLGAAIIRRRRSS